MIVWNSLALRIRNWFPEPPGPPYKKDPGINIRFAHFAANRGRPGYTQWDRHSASRPRGIEMAAWSRQEQTSDPRASTNLEEPGAGEKHECRPHQSFLRHTSSLAHLKLSKQSTQSRDELAFS